MQGKNKGERKNRVKKTEDSSCSLLSHFWSTFQSPFSTCYIPFQSLGSQESNASNRSQIRAEMKKLWPLEDNRTKLKDNFASCEMDTFSLRNFRKLEGISQSLAKLKNFATPFLALRNFRNLVKSSCNLKIFLHQLR